MPTCAKCHDTFPLKLRIAGKVRNLQRRKFCLACSPFGHHNTKRLDRAPRTATKHDCALCSKSFSTVRGNRCCPTCEIKLRRLRMKVAAVQLLGGKCVKCGWRGPAAGFDFHHTGAKNFGLGAAGTIAWARFRAEVLECTLLCAMCHRLEHHTLSEDFHAAVYAYRGKMDLGPELPRVAQLEERTAHNGEVVGSAPTPGTN